MKKIDTICFYHSADLDGICSGAIVKRFNPSVELRGYDYGKQFPWEDVVNKDIIMVDVSLPVEQMKKLKSIANSFIWIDHHKSSIEDAANGDFSTNGLKEIGTAACELCWKFFFNELQMPTTVKMLGRYDVWDHRDIKVLPFQYGARHHINGVDDPNWNLLLNSPSSFYDSEEKALDAGELLYKIFDDGDVILKYQTGENKKIANTCAFETKLLDLRVIACNNPLTNSKVFDDVWDEDKHDAMLSFYINKDKNWRCSLYTTKDSVDVSGVAKILGGGGHAKAAGFIVKNGEPFPFAI